MSLAAGNTILASDFINLKARIKAECARRKYNGSVASYANSQYDYTVTPTAGNHVLPEHYNKIVVPYNALTGSNLPRKKVDDVVPALKNISDNLAILEAKSPEDPSSGCKASCTGLCQGTCASGCTSCTGSCTNACTSCTGGCKASCTGGCTSCTGGCGDICHTDCATGCYSKCDDSCSPTCSYNCALSCTGSCEGGCLVRCKGICKGITTEQPIN